MAEQPAAADETLRDQSDRATPDEADSRSGRGLRRRVGGRLMGAGAWTLVAILLLVAGLIFIAGRTVTLQWAAQQVVDLSDGRLQIEGISGSVLSEIAADSVRWHDRGLVVSITAPRITYQPFALLDGLVRIERISASQVAVTLPSSDAPAEEPRAPIRLPRAMAALLPVAVERVDAARVVIRRDERELAALHNLEAVLRHDGDRINASLLNLDLFVNGTRVGMRGEAAVLARAPYATDGRLTVQVPLRPQALRVDVRISGPVAELAVRATTTVAGAPVEARTVVHSLDARLLRQVRLEVKDLDLARYDRSLPSTRLSGTYEAEVMPAWANERKPLLIGPVELSNAAAGPLDRKRIPLTAAKAVVGWVDGRLEMQALQASGPVGEVSGDGWVGDGNFRLALSSGRLQLRAINSTLKPRFVAAQVAVEPIAAAGAERAAEGRDGKAVGSRIRRAVDAGLRFDIEARDPTLAAEMKAVLVQGRLRISQAQVQLRAPSKGGGAAATGMASFRGEIGIAGAWPVDLTGTFRDFDPGQLAATPPALLNGKWRVAGHAGAGSEGGLLRAEVTLADSRLRDLPLAGALAADVALKDGEPRRLSAVDAKLRWGSSTVAASGALGEDGDALQVAFELPKIGEMRRWLQGALRGEGVLSGTLAAPVARGGIEGRNLVATAGMLRATIAGATLQIRAPEARAGQMELQARFDGVAVRTQGGNADAAGLVGREISFQQVTASADGSLARHALRIEAAGADQGLMLAASGSLDDDGLWHGSVERLEASGPVLRPQPAAAPAATVAAAAPASPAAPAGAADLQSLRPFPVTLGDDYFNARDARLLVHGALLTLRDLDWQGPVLAVRGDAAGIEAGWLRRFPDIGRWLPNADDASAAPAGSSATAGTAAGPEPLRQDLRLAAAMDFRGNLADGRATDWRGVLNVRRESGDLALVSPAGGPPVQARLKTFEASASIGSQLLKLVVNVDGDNIGWLSAEAQAPLQVRGGPAWSRDAVAHSPLSGRIQLGSNSFRWISPRTGGDWRVDGAISARLQLAGTVLAPRADGFISGTDLHASDPARGLDFSNGVFAAELDGDRLDVKLLRFSSGEGSVAISGVVPAAGNGRSEARIIVDRLAVALGKGERVVLSGSTTATLHGGALAIAGRLVADEGDFDLDGAGPRSETRSGGRPGGGADDLAVSADVELDLGRLFRVSGGGIHAGLGGVIRLHGSPPDELRATGTVELLHGYFDAAGRGLRIKRGRLMFDGAIDNPTLDVVAIRDYLKVEPGIAIRGPAQAPVVELVSEPAVGEADALSWLMLGRAAADAPRADDLAGLQVAVDGARGAAAAAADRLSSRLGGLYEQGLEAIRNILKLQYEITTRLSPGVRAGVPAMARHASAPAAADASLAAPVPSR